MFDFAPPWYSDEELGVCGCKGGTGEGCGGPLKCLVVRQNPQAECTWSKWDKAKQIASVSDFGRQPATILGNNLAINPISCKTETNLVFGSFVAV